jgi:hypothetical protein
MADEHTSIANLLWNNYKNGKFSLPFLLVG